MRKVDFEFSPREWQTNIGLIDDEFKSLIFDDGSLGINWNCAQDDFDISDIQSWEISHNAALTNERRYFDHKITPKFTHHDNVIERKQSLLSPRHPIVITKTECEYSTFTTKAFAYKNADVRVDIILWEINAKDNFGSGATKVELSIDGNADTLPNIYQNRDNDEYWMGTGLKLIGVSQSKLLHSNETRKGVFVVEHSGSFDPETATIEFGERALEEMMKYWDEQILFAEEFQVPDLQIQDFLTACSRNILQAREEKDEVLEYQVGPTVYRGLWIVDGYFLLDAAYMMTKDEQIFEQGILSTLRRVKPNGAIRIIADHEKETGIGIATLVRLCEVFNRDDKIKELWPTILRCVDFLETLMDEAAAMGPEYLGHKMFPPMFIDGGIDGKFAEFTTAWWNLFGLKKAMNTANRLGLEDAGRIERLYGRLRQGTLETIEENMRVTDSGIPYFPQNLEHREGYDRPQSATWAFSQAIYPGELFKPEDQHVKNLLALFDDIDNEQGIPKETGWVHDQALWPYNSMFCAENFLYAGDHEKAVDYLYAFANHACPTMVWREEQSLKNSRSNEWTGDMPHNWGSAEFIRLVRNLIIFETEDNLELLKGLPDQWLPTEGNPLSIQRSPTKYGAVSVKLEKSGEQYKATYHIDKGNQKPQTLSLRWGDQVITLEDYSGELLLEK